MLPRVSLFALLTLTGLAACDPKTGSGPRLEFVGSSRLTSDDKIINTAGDTLTTQLAGSLYHPDDPLLQHYTIVVDYTPKEKAADKQFQLVYFDTTFNSATFDYRFTFNTRTSSGQERWKHTLTNTDGTSAQRSYLLTVRNPDSLKEYHPYKAVLEAARRTRSRSALSARAGLVFPIFTVQANPVAQQLTDLLLVPQAAGVELVAPADKDLTTQVPFLPLGAWPVRNTTTIHLTHLTPTQFGKLLTAANLVAVYDSTKTAPVPTRSGQLVKDQVLAFRTADGHTGVLLTTDVSNASPSPKATVQVRIDN